MTQKTVKIEVELPVFEEWEPTGEFRGVLEGEACLYLGRDQVFVPSGTPFGRRHIYRRKRWRAEEGGDYWVLISDGRVGISSEGLLRGDNATYEYGNYFRTEEQAKAAAEAIKTALAKFHEEFEE